ncbi:MAG: hypothetical protein U0625_04940 [Phycisphaerales bacterium]
METKYRFRNGDAISAWLTASGLREAVKSKQLRPDSQIQKAGREDWVLASTVPDLFPPEPPPAPEAPKEEEPARADARAGVGARPAETIHHLLHRSLRSTLQLRAPDRAQPVEATLIGLSADCIIAELPDHTAILYLPLARIRSVAISARFPAQGPPRRGETLLVDIDWIPETAESLAAAPA